MKSRITLLGIPIDAVTRQQGLSVIRAMLGGGKQHQVITPNNEMLVESVKNPRFAGVLTNGNLNLPDSRGLLLMARWTGQHLPERVTGADMTQALCGVLDGTCPVFLLGAAPGVAEKAAVALRSANSQLKIAGTHSGSPRKEDAQAIIDAINKAKPKLLLVAFGAPAQELWIADHLEQMPSVIVAMGVGGTFDFIAGVKKRAPVFMQKLGLEWLWRFIQEPSRWRRMWRAVVVFPWLVMTRSKIKD